MMIATPSEGSEAGVGSMEVGAMVGLNGIVGHGEGVGMKEGQGGERSERSGVSYVGHGLSSRSCFLP